MWHKFPELLLKSSEMPAPDVTIQYLTSQKGFFFAAAPLKSWLFLFSIYNQCKEKSFFPLLSEMIPDDFSLAFLFLLIFPLLEFKVINIFSVWLKLLSLQSSHVCLKQYDNSKGKQFK